MYQQGDVLIKQVDSIPENARKVQPARYIVLAEGEATGHAHTITDTRHATLLDAMNQRYLEITAPVEVVHEEHETIILQPGLYEIDIVREYDHFAEEARRVVD